MANNRAKLIITLSCLFTVLFSFSLLAQDISNQDRLLQERAAKRLLDQAISFRNKGEYNKAAKELIIITDYYSAFSQIDFVFVELGNVLTDMELYSAASRIFRHVINNYGNSIKVPYVLYGLQRINYLQDKYDRSLEFYTRLEKSFPNADVGSGKYYYAGQNFLALDDPDKAIIAFEKIERNSEFQAYGLYSKAMAKLKKKIFNRLWII